MVFLWFSHGHPMASHGLQMLDAIVQEGVRAVVHRRLPSPAPPGADPTPGV